MTSRVGLLASHEARPRLRIWDDCGFRPIESADHVGDIGAPAASAESWIAFQFVSRGVPERWLSGTAILDSEGSLFDILPSALPTAAPVWSPDATELARVVTTYTGASQVEVVTLDSGESRILLDSPGITAVSWPSPAELLVAQGSRVVSVNTCSGSATVRLEWAAAENLLGFGSDDIFPTISHIATQGDQRVLEVRWHSPGRSSVPSIYRWTDDEVALQPQMVGCRQPEFLRERHLLLTTDHGVVIVDEQGATVWRRDLPALIAAAPWPDARTNSSRDEAE